MLSHSARLLNFGKEPTEVPPPTDLQRCEEEGGAGPWGKASPGDPALGGNELTGSLGEWSNTTRGRIAGLSGGHLI